MERTVMTTFIFPVTPACTDDIHHQQHHLFNRHSTIFMARPKLFLTKVTELLSVRKPNFIMPGIDIKSFSHFIFHGGVLDISYKTNKLRDQMD